jgi:hypothetical protein
MGGSSTVNDETDIEDDMNDCTIDSCSAGTPKHAPAAAGTACGMNGMGTCDGTGVCMGG